MNLFTRIPVLVGTASLVAAALGQSAPTDSLPDTKIVEKPKNLVAQANSGFAIDLYRALSKKERGNLFFSPFSITSALTMCAEGARGTTALELGKVLRFPEEARRQDGDDAGSMPWDLPRIRSEMEELCRPLAPEDTPHQKAIREYIAVLRAEQASLAEAIKRAELEERGKRRFFGENPSPEATREREVVRQLNALIPRIDQYELSVANALWVERRFPLRPDFMAAIKGSYGKAGIFAADFQNEAEAERSRINLWAAEQTQQKITHVLPPGAVTEASRLVLTNAIYFRGSWLKPFEKGRTKQEDFFITAESPVKVPMMNAPSLRDVRYGAFQADGSWFETPIHYEEGTEPVGYPGKGGFSMVEIPYKGGDLSMVVLAPIDLGGLGAIEAALDGERLAGWIGHLRERRTHVALPRFKAETDYDLKGALRTLGMGDAFDRKAADFSGMADLPAAGERLFIDSVIHKASVSVNEEGTEAAAVTATGVWAVGMSARGRMLDFIPTFRADRPFLFLIRDTRSGSVLFMGRITRP